MLEKIIVGVIVLLCAFFIGRRFYRQLSGSKKNSGCGCSCSGCDSQNSRDGCSGMPKPPQE